MSSSETRNECEWLAWRVRNKTRPLLESLSADNARAFAGEVRGVLAGT